MAMSVSLSDTDFIEEVRDALAEMDSNKIPDDTILNQRDRLVEPAINKAIGGGGVDQTDFDNAVILYTAEQAFNSWLAKSQMTDSGTQVSVSVSSFREKLDTRSRVALDIIGVSKKNIEKGYPVIIDDRNLES